MKRARAAPAVLAALACAGLAAPGAARADAPAIDLQQIEDLGRANGRALACQAAEAARQSRALVLQLAPKTAQAGAAFERGTQEGYAQQMRAGSACPGEDELGLQVAALAARAGDEPINPRYLLDDVHGHAVTNEDFPDRYQLVVFGYTSCADVCPTTLARLARIRAGLGARASQLQVVFVTLDPTRDTPAHLGDYVRYFDPTFVALTGPPERVRSAADHFHIAYQAAAAGAGGDYTIDHGTGLILLDRRGDYVARYGADAPVAETTARIRALLEAEGH